MKTQEEIDAYYAEKEKQKELERKQFEEGKAKSVINEQLERYENLLYGTGRIIPILLTIVGWILVVFGLISSFKFNDSQYGASKLVFVYSNFLISCFGFVILGLASVISLIKHFLIRFYEVYPIK